MIVLSDRNADSVDAPIPSLLLTSAVHHHLVRTKQRTKVGLVVECGDAREVHHMALLVGYGAGAINPYLAFESIEDLIAEGLHGMAEHRPPRRGQELHQGLRQGRAQGDVEDGRVDRGVVHRRADLRGDRSRRASSSTSTSPARSAVSAASVSTRSRRPSRCATRSPTLAGPEERAHRKLELGGEYQWRREGEYHLFNPDTVFKLQHATRAEPLRHLQGVHARSSTTSRRTSPRCAACSSSPSDRPPVPDRRGRAGRRDRQAVLDRGDVVRLDLGRGPRDARRSR